MARHTLTFSFPHVFPNSYQWVYRALTGTMRATLEQVVPDNPTAWAKRVASASDGSDILRATLNVAWTARRGKVAHSLHVRFDVPFGPDKEAPFPDHIRERMPACVPTTRAMAASTRDDAIDNFLRHLHVTPEDKEGCCELFSDASDAKLAYVRRVCVCVRARV